MKKALSTALILLITGLLPGFALELTGQASWYGGHFHGRKTANGEIFDTYELTAAHKELPFNTMVKVVNESNGKSVMVRINDRGPYVGERIIDLSYAAAQKLDMVEDGVAEVTLIIDGMDRLEITYTIQVGAYKTPQYARDLVKRLKQAGYNPRVEKTPGGVIRVLITEVPEGEMVPIVSRLRSRGFKNLLVKQN